jgi:predicted ATPase/class 3 adenylate cyclase
MLVARPTGTVTFLFTDIEGSTRRWERGRDAMRIALARHDALMRNAITAHGGSVFKTVGDAFCAAFATAPEALAAALDAQRALQAEDFGAVGGMLVRMALHTGTAQERDDDYFGPAVNRVARLLAIGHGGQVLVSHTTADLLQGELPANISLRDLGAHQLKDLTRPEHVYQLIADDLSETFPALRSLGGLPNNLPPQLTSFIGRESDLAAIKTLLQNHRLVTLVGTGGAGKTRCAIQAGAELLESFRDGVWLVELAPISDAFLVPAAIARELGMRESLNRPVLDTLLAYLEHQEILIILDNCEHLIEEARRVAAAILRACPAVRILATSRESLSIAGERTFRLSSLAVPPAEEAPTAQAVLRYDAVELFTDRALASDARFTLTDENAPFVAEISARLDGIPLAIELAAARVKVLSPKQLAQKLDERFRVLTGGDRSALPRHQTMRALIDWSYDLLSERERMLFRKLSIFAGGFTLASASAVCGDDASDEIAVLDVLSSLVDKSLVQADAAGEARFRLLESTRQYAREKLIAGDEHLSVVRAHAAAFLGLAEQLEAAWETMSDLDWVAQAEPELENWRAALEWALASRGDVLLGQRLAGALGRMWAFSGPAEGRRWVNVALETATPLTAPAVIARLELTGAQLDAVLGVPSASYATAERALSRYRALDDAWGVAAAQRLMGSALVLLGRSPDGEALLRKTLAALPPAALKLKGAVLDSLAVARNAVDDLEGARAFYAQAQEIFKATGALRLAAAVSVNLAETVFRGGDAEAALRLAEEALAADRAAKFTRIPLLCANMAAYLVALGRYAEARSYAREALVAGRRTHHELAMVWALQRLAAVAALQPNGGRRRGAQLLGYVDAQIAAREIRRQYTEEREYDAMLSALGEALGADELANLMDEGGAWREDEAISEGMLV